MNIVILLKNGQEIATQLQSEKDLLIITDRINDGKAIVIGGSVYHGWEITRIMGEKDYKAYRDYVNEQEIRKQETQMRMSGLWKCAYGYWHEKNQECGHDLEYGSKPSTKIDGFIEYRHQNKIKKNTPLNSIKNILENKS